jgi:hypothetical protein
VSDIAVTASTTPSHPPATTGSTDIEFDRRWAAWKARGLARERSTRRRLLRVAIVVVAIAVVSLAAYALRSA